MRGVLAGIACANVLLVGCGSETVSGQVQEVDDSRTRAGEAALFDGCSQVPDDALAAAGMNPAIAVPEDLPLVAPAVLGA